MDFSQAIMFFDLSFQCVILHLLMSVWTQFTIFFFGGGGVLLVNFLEEYFYKHDNLPFNIHSVNMTDPIQPTYSDK